MVTANNKTKKKQKLLVDKLVKLGTYHYQEDRYIINIELYHK